MGIEKKFPRCSNKIFKKMFTYLQKWKIVLKAEEDYGRVNAEYEVCWLEDFWKQIRRIGGGLASVACFTASSSLGVWLFYLFVLELSCKLDSPAPLCVPVFFVLSFFCFSAATVSIGFL